MSKKLSYGDEYWEGDKSDEQLWSELPLKYFKETKGKKILEVGSGYGLFLYYLSRDNEVVGLEIDKERVGKSIKILKEKGRKVKVIEGDARKLPFKDETFDVVFCHGVIEHFKESDKAIAEGYRVLKKGGIAMYSVPARFSLFVLIKIAEKIVDKIFGSNLWKCGYEKSFTPWKFKGMLKKEGFKIINFEANECGPGRNYPLVGKIMRMVDKPFWLMGIGGRLMHSYCIKE